MTVRTAPSKEPVYANFDIQHITMNMLLLISMVADIHYLRDMQIPVLRQVTRHSNEIDYMGFAIFNVTFYA